MASLALPRIFGMTRPMPSTPSDLTIRSDASGIVRLTAAGAIAANVLLPLIEFWRVTMSGETGALGYAAFASVAIIALQLRHVVFALRNEQPPAAGWTLGALAALNAAAAVLVGRAWALQFASLAVSVLLLLPARTAIVLAIMIAFSPLGLEHSSLPLWESTSNLFIRTPWTYLVLAIIWRTMTLYVPVRLVMTIRQLEATRRDLESRAILQTRSRIEEELRDGLGRALERIVDEGDEAQSAVQRHPEDATREIRDVSNDARRALTEARRIVAGYRSTTLGAELDAATALLEASGASVRLVITPGISLDVGAAQARSAVRAAVIQALQDGPRGEYAVHVWLDEHDEPQIRVDAGRPASGALG